MCSPTFNSPSLNPASPSLKVTIRPMTPKLTLPHEYHIIYYSMNQSDSEEHEPGPIIEQVNIYTLISAAKPVISPTRALAKQLPFRAVPTFDPVANSKKGLFRRDGGIEQYPFACNFEGGNLESVQQTNSGTFIIKLRNDTNSRHQSSWFYFKVRGIRTASFEVRGLPKPNLLYSSGMKLCVRDGDKWQRGGTYINYVANPNGEYTLQFQLSFARIDQPTEVATCFPYGYAEVQALIKQLCRRHPKLVQRQSIGRSVLGNEVESLVIAAGPTKPVILISARVHPSETVSSFIAHGFLEWLMSSQQAQQLLEAFEVRVIPMLNPDGVVRGNHRFSFAGTDLNRKWKNPGHRLHPQIYHTRNYIQDIDVRRIRMIVDLHGHSRKKGVFFYGCEEEKSLDSKVREFPYLMSKISSYYEYSKCCFKVQQSKEGTARIYLWKLLKIPYIYTLECSLCGAQGSRKNFDIVDLLKIGADLGRGLFIFFSDALKSPTETVSILKKSFQEEFRQDSNVLFTEQGSDGSESQPSEGELEEDQVIDALENMKGDKGPTITSATEANNSTKPLSFDTVEDKSLTTAKTFRKKTLSSFQYDRRKKAMSLISKIDASQSFKSYQADRFFTQKHAEFIEGKRAEAGGRVKYLDQILLSSDPHLIDIPYCNGPGNRSAKLNIPEQYPSKQDAVVAEPEKADTISAEMGFKSGFYGAQYVRVKKYAEKILKDRERKAPQTPQSGTHIGSFTAADQLSRNSLRKQPTQLKLQIIPLRAKKKEDESTEITKRLRSSRRSTTVNK